MGVDDSEAVGGSRPPLADRADPERQISAFAPPAWARDVGRWSWIIVGVIIVLAAAFVVGAAMRLLVLATLFAILFGGTFMPVVDWLGRHRFKRWLGALLVVVFLIALGILVVLIVTYGLVNEVPVIERNLQAAADSIKELLDSTSLPESTVDSVKSGLETFLEHAGGGVASAIGGLINDVAGLLFGIFISINILVWVLIQGREIGSWASRHLPPLPPPVAYRIIADSARFFRGYIWGSTLVGLFNAAVLGVGAAIIGVPMAPTLAIVAWLTNYIPYFGAIISGAFAVLIAYGAGGPSMAIPMLIVVILANGFLQTLVSQFALGSALKLHPLVVLFATTAGGLLAGAVGGVFAGPFTKIGLDAYRSAREAGVFEGGTPTAVGSAAAPGGGERTDTALGP